MNSIHIVPYYARYQADVQRILIAIGWGAQYAASAQASVLSFSQNPTTLASYVATADGVMAGFLYVQYYEWNQLAQIHGLVVDPAHHRQGIARALVQQAEAFARGKQARGVYVDTPTLNTGARHFYEAAGYQVGYIMPRYYEDKLDGVTYQKFFSA